MSVRKALLVAEGQFGVLARGQAVQAGMTERQVDHLVARGLWAVAFDGVYRPGGSAPSPAQDLMAACLAAGPGAMASHRSAAWLHGLLPAPKRPEISVVRPARGPQTPAILVHRPRTIDRLDVGTVRGIRATRVERTLVDLAAALPVDELEDVLDQALHSQATRVARLCWRLAVIGLNGRRNATLLARLVYERGGGPACESALETRVSRLLRREGYPVSGQVTVRDNGFEARIDFVVAPKVGVEALGFAFHGRGVAFRRDRRREARLRSLGWTLVPVTWWDLPQPADFLADLDRALVAAGFPEVVPVTHTTRR
jgi:hypothetical protein